MSGMKPTHDRFSLIFLAFHTVTRFPPMLIIAQGWSSRAHVFLGSAKFCHLSLQRCVDKKGSFEAVIFHRYFSFYFKKNQKYIYFKTGALIYAHVSNTLFANILYFKTERAQDFSGCALPSKTHVDGHLSL
jgi:hypothetical protein